MSESPSFKNTSFSYMCISNCYYFKWFFFIFIFSFSFFHIRFLLLNDVISSYLTYGEYRCVLRKSYNFPSDYDSSLKSYVTYKKINSANYLFLCKQQDHSQPSTVPRFHPVVITVDVNVGEQNQWNRYTSNALVDFDRAFGSFCMWQDETLQLKFSSYVPEGPVYYEYLFT